MESYHGAIIIQMSNLFPYETSSSIACLYNVVQTCMALKLSGIISEIHNVDIFNFQHTKKYYRMLYVCE